MVAQNAQFSQQNLIYDEKTMLRKGSFSDILN